MKRFNDGRDWFFNRRYGMFIHWGLYSINGFHEQEMMRRNIPRKDYMKLADVFCPSLFNPDEWIDKAIAAGFEYMVFTAKHQDGFCMWDTEFTKFNIMNTPYGRDILKELSDACHRRGFPLLLYYSVTDNNHPSYPNQDRGHELPQIQEGDLPDTDKYLDFVKQQITELCTNYGKIDGFFWDVNHLAYRDESFNNIIRDLQPTAVINCRGFDEGDYGTPEREYNDGEIASNRCFSVPTEACQSVGMQSWGYKTDEDFYSSKYLMQCIDRIMAMGGNYLLNTGPKPDGRLEDAHIEIFIKIKNWLDTVRESLYGAVPVSACFEDKNIFATLRGNDLYIHFYRDPIGTSYVLDKLDTPPETCILLNDGRPLPCKRSMGVRTWSEKVEYVRIRELPVEEYFDKVMIVKLTYKHLPQKIADYIKGTSKQLKI